MSRKNKKILSLVLSICLLGALVAVACAPQERPDPNEENYGAKLNPDDNMDRAGNSYTNNRYSTRFDNPGPYTGDTDRLYGFFGDDFGNGMDANDRMGGMDGMDRMDGMDFRNTPMNRPNNMNNMNVGMNMNARLENACEDVAGVEDATVIRNGDTCYVGVDNDGRNAENVAGLRTQIASKCRSVDPSIKRVYVTSDENRVTKLRNYARDIDGGQPVRNMMNDLEDLFR